MYRFHIPASDLKFRTARELAEHLSAQAGVNIRIPKDATAQTIAPYGAYIVQRAAAPTVTAAQVAEEDTQIVHANGVSTQGWVVRNKTTQELAADAQAARALMVVNPTPFAMAAEELGVITLAEATAWLEQNTLPQFIVDAVTAQFSDPQTSQVTDQAGLDRALLRLRNLETVRRLGSFIEVLRLARGYTHEFVDQIFERAAQIQETL